MTEGSPKMDRAGKLRCVLYAVVGLVALIGGWANILGYLDHGLIGGTIIFWQETLATPVSQFITIDLLFLALTASVWMVSEARRLEMRGVWVYIVVGMLIAISATVPAFMIQRERALASGGGEKPAPAFHPADLAGLVLLFLLFSSYMALTFTR